MAPKVSSCDSRNLELKLSSHWYKQQKRRKNDCSCINSNSIEKTANAELTGNMLGSYQGYQG